MHMIALHLGGMHHILLNELADVILVKHLITCLLYLFQNYALGLFFVSTLFVVGVLFSLCYFSQIITKITLLISRIVVD